MTAEGATASVAGTYTFARGRAHAFAARGSVAGDALAFSIELGGRGLADVLGEVSGNPARTRLEATYRFAAGGATGSWRSREAKKFSREDRWTLVRPSLDAIAPRTLRTGSKVEVTLSGRSLSRGEVAFLLADGAKDPRITVLSVGEPSADGRTVRVTLEGSRA